MEVMELVLFLQWQKFLLVDILEAGDHIVQHIHVLFGSVFRLHETKHVEEDEILDQVSRMQLLTHSLITKLSCRCTTADGDRFVATQQISVKEVVIVRFSGALNKFYLITTLFLRKRQRLQLLHR